MVYRRTPAVVSAPGGQRSRTEAPRAISSPRAAGDMPTSPVVAQKAGAATGTVYRYFPSKAELFAEVLANVSRRERDVVAAIIDGEGTPAVRLCRCGGERSPSRALQGHRLAYAMIVEPCEPGDRPGARLVPARPSLGEEFVRLIEIGQQQRLRSVAAMHAPWGPVSSVLSWRRWLARWHPRISGGDDAFAQCADPDDISDACLAYMVGAASRPARPA